MIIFKKTIFFFTLLFICFSVQSQTKWETEREKEHGVLRMRIDGLTLDDDYYFIYQNLQTKKIDTLRNREMHLDLGNSEPPHAYNMGKILKTLPQKLYGKNTQHIYRDWYYVSFPILGLSQGKIVATDSKTNSIMRVHIEFDTTVIADYIFQLEFQEGDFLIEAPLLKQYALSKQSLYYDSTIQQSELLHTPFKLLEELTVIRSQTDNFNLSIVDIGNPEPLGCFPFYNKVRYSSPLFASFNIIEHPFYKKIKYQTPYAHIMIPEYMEADESNYRQNAYCVEHSYVLPNYLYSPAEANQGSTHTSRSNPKVNRRCNGTTVDTTFLPLESYIEAALFSKSNLCNEPIYSVSQVNFPYNSDSMVSIELTERIYILPTADSLVMAKYTRDLHRAIEKAERPSKNNFFRFFKRRKKLEIDDKPFMPRTERLTLPIPDYEVEIPKNCDNFIYSQSSKNNLNNGYYSWEAVKPCYDVNDTNTYSIRYTSMVVNPYTLQPYNPENLFGPRFREVVYVEIMKEHDKFKASVEEIDFNFNEQHYKPELERHFMWGLDQKHLIIYYGNEGEFQAYRKLLIPFELFY
ncbi:MAG: hypothetical protein ACJA2N_001942 [Salibacteraceae bacterium]|jgi:hypothetical protein